MKPTPAFVVAALIHLFSFTASAQSYFSVNGGATVAGTVTQGYSSTNAAPSMQPAVVDQYTNFTTIALKASRTILYMEELVLYSGQTLNFSFNDRDDIVLVVVSGTATINGSLTATLGPGGQSGGNVWIAAVRGIAIDSTASVTVDGLLATTSIPTIEDFFDDDQQFFFSGASDGRVRINGGSITATSTMLFVAPFIDQAGTIGEGFGSRCEVLYGAGSEFLLRLGNSDGYLGVVDFAFSRESVSQSIVLEGTTIAGDIWLASRALSAGSFVAARGPLIANGPVAGGAGNIVISTVGGLSRPSSAGPMQIVGDPAAAPQDVHLGYPSGRDGTRRMEAADLLHIRTKGELVVSHPLTSFSGEVILAADAFTNTYGFDAVTASRRWLIYSSDPAANAFGSLDSGNPAHWNASIDTAPPATLTGNRYVFTAAPTATFRSEDHAKAFGVNVADLSFAVSGFHPGVPAAFRGDTDASVYTGKPALASAGTPASAAPGDYPIAITQGTLDAVSGYQFAFESAGTLRVDATAPEITSSVSPSANAAGWHNTPPVVSWLTIDPETGVAATDGCEARTISTDTHSISITCSATNRAGLTSSSTIVVKLDTVAPVITGTRLTAPNADGWNNSDVTVAFTCNDDRSGVVSCTAAQTISSEGASQSGRGVATDAAGNSADAEVAGINIDKTGPSVRGTASRPPDSNGWYSRSVDVTWSGTDALSGVASCAAATGYAGPDDSDAQLTGTCVDKAGNLGHGVSSIQYDATAPVIAIVQPGNTEAYLLNEVAHAQYSCVDPASGVDDCIGTVAAGTPFDTRTVGDFTFAVAATDRAGNRAVLTHGYRVVYDFAGFFAPLGNLPSVNSGRAGRTYPVKFAIRDANGAAVSDRGAVAALITVPVACGTTTPAGSPSFMNLADLTYDGASGWWQFAWRTSRSAAGCWNLEVRLADGSARAVAFELR